MGTLTDEIRRLTGASSDVVSDPDVQAALDANRIWQDAIEVVLHPTITGVAKRGTVDAWGLLEPGTDQSTHVTIEDSLGVLPGPFTLDADGTIVFDDDQADSPSLYLTAFGYDVHAAAVQVLDQMIDEAAAAYDVKLGDQTFNRSQAVAPLERKRARLARLQLVGLVHRGRIDEVASSTRRARRRDRY